jgi:mannitol-1-/sugar-/sorbitol-6-/2-deoxyglucose-6-phosphatase
MPIEAVIFDMDGVIVASEDYWLESRVEYVGSLGKTWTDDDQRACMGVNTIEWGHLMKQRQSLEPSVDTIMDEVKGRVISRLEARLPVLPGAVEAVHTAASKFRVGLASGSPTAVIKRVTELTGLDKVFEVMVFGDDMERGKPNPDIYWEAARQLGVEPANCVGIEDSSNGVRALKAAGMKIIAVPSPGFALSPEIVAMADVHLSSLEQFSVELVEGLGR